MDSLFVGSLSVLLAIACWEYYLTWRQRRKCNEETVPVEIREYVTDEEFTNSRLYNKASLSFQLFCEAIETVISVIFLLYGFYPYVWNNAVAKFPNSSEFVQSLYFVVVIHSISYAQSLPFSLYHDFVLEERFGFNKKTLRLFVTDELKMLMLKVVIGTPILWIVIMFVHWAGPQCYIWLFLFSVVFSLVMMFAYPVLIAPLFNKYENIKDDELRVKIENMASKLNFPLKKLFQVDGSIRSSHSNAYMYGFGNNKRIVLYDTLLGLPHPQILAILGHEIGHWAHWHMVKSLLLGYIQTFAILYLFKLTLYEPATYNAFGFQDTPVVGGIIVFSVLIAPISAITGLFMTLLSRKHEFQADAFACKEGYGPDLAEGLKSLFKENKGNLNPDEWYAWYNYSHPPLVERLRTIVDEAQKAHTD